MANPKNAPAAAEATSQASQTSTDAPAAAPSNVSTNVLPFKIKVIKQVSTNLLKLRAGMTAYVTITGKMEKAKELKKQSAENKAKEPPTLIPVTNLETGEVQSIIAGSVLVDLSERRIP
jgi:hypothetical protein